MMKEMVYVFPKVVDKCVVWFTEQYISKRAKYDIICK